MLQLVGKSLIIAARSITALLGNASRRYLHCVMKDINAFLYGKVIAQKMRAIENTLKVLAEKHQDYFASQQSKYAAAGEHRSATITEFVEPRWINMQPTLWVDPALPADIAAECTASFYLAIS
jgi:hypothetical protein